MSLIDHSSEQQAALAALKASQVELTDGLDAALALLGPPTDPIRMRATLEFLIRADRYEGAADLIRDHRPESVWLHLAAFAHARTGDLRSARALIAHADDSCELAVARRCRLAFGEAAIDRLQARSPNASPLSRTDWLDADIELANEVIQTLDLLLCSIRASRKINGDGELSASICVLYSAWICRDRSLFAEITSLLLRHVPVPLVVGELCLRGQIDSVPKGLANRLRIEHPNQFDAYFLAALIERDVDKNAQDAFESLVELVPLLSDDAERDSLSIALFETCGLCGVEQTDKAIELATEILPENKMLLGLMRVTRYMLDDDFASARRELETIRDETNGAWWQCDAQLRERDGDHDGAQQAWERASELIPHPEVLRRSIQASLDRRRYESAIQSLTILLEAEPENTSHLRALAWAHTELGDHSQAAVPLARLVQKEPDNSEYRMWLAQALAFSAQNSDAIDAIAPIIDSDDCPLEATMLFSSLLAAVDQPMKAFSVLDDIAADYWEDPRFICAYMQRAHAAKYEKEAGEALTRLIDLRRQGKVGEDLLQEVTLEQILDRGQDYRRRRDFLHESLINGRFPWLSAEEILGNPPSWAWMLHTQQVGWVSENPASRAALSIYSTNSFTHSHGPEGTYLVRISSPSHGTVVAVDLSALLTLHRLGILEETAAHFGQLLVPASYGPLRLQNSERYAQHQPAREDELHRIRESVEQKQISVVSDTPTDALFLDEFSDLATQHAYRLADLVDLLSSTNKLTDSERGDLGRLAKEPSSVDETHRLLGVGDTIVIDLTTLRCIASTTAYSKVLDCAVVCITHSAHDELHSELKAYDTARSAREFAESLWDEVTRLADLGKIALTPCSTNLGLGEGDDGEATESSVFLDSVALANDKEVPLLADDRVLQVLRSVESVDGNDAAFGTDVLLSEMVAGGRVSDDVAARHIRQLMAWRYRFLIPSSKMLLAWAKESPRSSPGPSLIAAAYYLHDCLRDPGLHCGMENTDPPMPMAAKFSVGWMTATIEFIAAVWNDETFTESQCSKITQWACDELLPSCPRGLWYQAVGTNVFRNDRESMFGMALSQFALIASVDHANHALRLLAQSLGITEEAYLALAASTIRTAAPSLAGGDTDDAAYARRMMQVSLYHYVDRKLDALAFSRFRAIGLFEDVEEQSFPETLEAAISEVIRDSSNASVRRRMLIVAPEGRTTVVPVEELLLQNRVSVRRMAVELLRDACREESPWLTPRTQDCVAQVYEGIQSLDSEKWRSAAVRLADLLREDILAALEGLRFSIDANYDEGIQEYLSIVLRPPLKYFANFRPPLWNGTKQRAELASWINELSERPVLTEALDVYVERCGYIPLASDLSAAELVRQWLARRNEASVSWKAISHWARTHETPAARYHAVTIALDVAAAHSSVAWDEWLTEATSLMEAEHDVGVTETDRRWRLFASLAEHYAQHIETLHPGQDGEVVSCYAWWLADRVTRIIGDTERNAAYSLQEIVQFESRKSQYRWAAGRSLVEPSRIRFPTSQSPSLWSMSILNRLCQAEIPSRLLAAVTEESRSVFTQTISSCLVASSLSHTSKQPDTVYALDENEHLERLCDENGIVTADARQGVLGLINLGKELSDPENVASQLNQLLDAPSETQQLILLALKSRVFSTRSLDDVVAKWLEHTDAILQMCEKCDDRVVILLLEMLAEFQQHEVGDWPIRIPHLVTTVIERLDAPERIGLLIPHVLLTSANSGLSSPIERLVRSGKWATWGQTLDAWRENMWAFAEDAESWTVGRVRSCSTVVSQLIGARRTESDDESERQSNVRGEQPSLGGDASLVDD